MNRVGNRNVRFFAAILFVVGLYAGFSLGFRRSETVSDAGHQPLPNSGSSSGAHTTPHVAARRAPSPAAVPSHPGGEEALIHAFLSSLAIPTPDQPQGTGVIQGIVTDEEGRGCPGVRITANPQQSPSRKRTGGTGPIGTSSDLRAGGPQPEGIEAEVRRTIEWQQQQRALRRETVTDLAGRYALSELASVPHHVTAARDGYIIEPQPRTPTLLTPDAELNFLARALVEIECNVRMPDGTAPTRASILISRDSSEPTRDARSYHAWTPNDPRIRVQPARYTCRAEVHEKELRMSSDPQTIAMTAAFDSVLNFMIRAPVGIQGSIRLPPGVQNASLQVSAIPWTASQPPAPRTLRERGKTAWVSIPHQTRYALPELQPDDYFVGLLSWNSDAILASGLARVADAMVELDLDLSAPATGNFVTVRVQGYDGKPLNDVSIWANSSVMSGRNPDGSHWIVLSRQPDATPPTLTVRSQSCGQKIVSCSPSEGSELLVVFDRPARLRVSLSGVPPPAGARLLVALRDRQDPRRSAASQSNFKTAEPALLQNVTAGDYQLTVSCQGDTGWHDIVSQPVALLAGDNQATVELPALHSLTVKVADPDYGNTLQLKTVDGRGCGHAWLADKGRQVTFEGLIAGRYVLEMTGGRRTGSMEVVVPAASVVAFAPPARNALQVTITRPEGYLGRAGLRTGDLLTALNDSEFKDVFNVDRILDSFSAMEHVTAIFYRGDKPHTITLDGRHLKGESAGGTFKGIQIQWQQP